MARDAEINPATGRPHNEDEPLYALRDREVARMERGHKALKLRFRQPDPATTRGAELTEVPHHHHHRDRVVAP